MTGQPDRASVIHEWVDKAERDFRIARHALQLTDDDEVYDVVCFHAQQCIEKYLKAHLLFIGGDIPKIHDLSQLAKNLPHSEQKKLPMADLPKLTAYAIESRYPGDWDPITAIEATNALKITEHIRDIIKKSIGL